MTEQIVSGFSATALPGRTDGMALVKIMDAAGRRLWERPVVWTFEHEDRFELVLKQKLTLGPALQMLDLPA